MKRSIFAIRCSASKHRSRYPLLFFGIVLLCLIPIALNFDKILAALGGSEINPSAHWTFDEGVDNTCSGGSNDACDSSGNNRDAAFGASTAAPTWQTEDKCVSGKCLYFDGNNDTANAGNVLAFERTNAFSLSAWFKSNKETQTIIAKQDSSSPYSGYNLQTGSGGFIYFQLVNNYSTNAIEVRTTNDTRYADNQWHHVVVTYSGTSSASGVKMYLDGKPVPLTTTKDNLSATIVNSINLNIGSRNGSVQLFEGLLDEVKVFSTSLTPAQVKAEYAGGAAVFGAVDTDFLNQGLVGYWPLDHTSGNATDGSGNGTTLTNVSSTAYTGARFGNGMEPDGAADYLYAADNTALSVTGSLTLAAWIIPDDVTGTENIIAKWDGTNESYRLTKEGANIRMYIDSDSNYQASTGSPIAANTLQHVAGVYDSLSQNVKLYVNGSEVTSSTTGTIPSSIGDDGGRFHLGAEDSTTTAANFFDGHIDDARIYSRAFSPAEVRALYNWAPGPVGYWPMDENSGTSTVYDKSGNGTNLTMYGSMTNDDWVPGKFGSALDFDGTNDVLAAADPNILDMGTNSFTVSAWVWRDTSSTVDQIVDKRQTGDGTACSVGTDVGYDLLIWDTNQISMSICDGTNGWEMYSSAGVVTTGMWHHVAAVVDRATLTNSQIYLDGIAISNTKINDGSDPPSSGNISNSNNFSIANNLTLNYPWDGRIDEVRIYNYPRTQQQIVEDMNAGHPAGGSPIGSQVAHWKLDEQYGTTVNNDVATNTFTETITGATWLTQADCKINGCLNFDGADDVLTITNADVIDLDTGLSSGFTFATWFWADTDGEGDVGQIFQKGTSTYCRTDSESGGRVDVECNLDLATTDANVNISSAVATGTWNHLVMTYDDAGTITIYINGVQRGANTGSGATASDTANLLIGGATTANFDGRIDEFQIFSSVLTPAQVLIVMNANSSVNFGVGTDEKSTTYGGPGGNPPIHEYKFDENTGTTAYDTGTAAKLNGTLTLGPSFVPGKFGSGISFDGVDSYVTLGSSAYTETDAFTISAWVYPRSFSAGIQIAGDISTSYTTFFIEGSWQGQTNALHYCGSVNCETEASDGNSANNVISLNTWQHVAMTYDGSPGAGSCTFYVNGVDVTLDSTCGETAYSHTTTIGGGDTPISGDAVIDHVRIYDYVQTPSQIAYDYNRGAPLAWYKFDECTGTTIYNNAKNSNGQATGENGTLTLGASGTTSAGTCSTSGAWSNGASGKFDASMDFDGTDDYIVATTTALFDALPRFSVAAWVYLDGWGGGNYGRIFDKGQNGSGYFGRGMFVCNDGGVNCNSQSLSFYQSFNSDTYKGWWSSPANSLSTGQWYHVAVTYDNTSTGNDPMMYINGKSVSVTENTTPISGTADNDADADLYIGNRYDTTRAFNGQIDDFRIYGYELSATQVKKVMNEGSAVRFGE